MNDETTFNSYLEKIELSKSKRVDLTPDDLLNITAMAASAENRQKLTDLRLGLLFSLIVKRMENFSSEQLTRLMIQIGNLNIIDTNKYYTNFFSIWENKMNDKMTNDKSQLFDILHIYVKFKEDFPEELVETWSRLATDQIETFSNQQLSECMEIFAVQKVKPNSQFVEKWAQRIRLVIEQLNSQELSNVVYSSGKLHINELDDRLSKLNQTKILSMNPHQLSKTMYGLVEGKIKLENDDKFKSGCVQILKDGMNSYDLHDLSRVIWCISKNTEFQNDELLWSTWERATTNKLEQNTVTAQDLNMILTSLARIQFPPNISVSSTLLKTWIRKSLEVMEKFWPEMLPNMLGDLCKLGEKPNDQFVKAWLYRIKETIGEIYGRDLVVIITSIADNRYFVKEYDKEFVNVWRIEADKKSSYWSSASKTALKSAFTSMDVEIDVELAKILNDRD